VKALVTGSSGFLGAAVARALSSAGHEVDGVDLRPAPTTTVVGDLLSDGGWRALARAADVVVHTAALVGDKGPLAAHEALNAGGTRRVLEAAGGRVVHLSSIVVHGSRFADGVDEDAPVSPTGNPYTDTKIASEHLALAAAARGRDVVVVRPGDVYGPGSPLWTLRAVRQLRARQLAAPSRGVLSPVYVDDVVAGVVLAATTEGASGHVLHLAGGVAVPPGEFFAHYGRMLGRRVPVLPLGLARAVAAPLTLLGDRAPLTLRTLEYVTHPGTYSIARAERVLGWRPQVDLVEGMRRTEAWLRAEGLLG
jgi:nucleoside-diphosphate-sugar epimerase